MKNGAPLSPLLNQPRIFALFLILVLGGCSGKKPVPFSPGPENPPRNAGESHADLDQAAGNKNLSIGFSVATDTFIIERWNKDIKVFSGAAQELGASVIIQLSAGGTREQIAQINYLVNRKIDILVVIAHDTELIAPAIKQVKDAGIPVIAYDRLIMGVPIDAFISFDSREVGRCLGKALIAAVPQGNYLVVNGSVNDSNSYEVNAGLHEILDPHVESGKIQVGKEIWLNEWSFDEALEKIGAIFEEDSNFDGIACGNDQIAGAAVQLLSERRLAGKAAVVGQDAELISCQHVAEGLQLMTVYKPIGRLAVRAARLAVEVAAKEKLSPDTLLNNRSGTVIPSYIEKPIAVFKDNMDVVIKDGFHSYEDIYRNIGLGKF